MQLGQVICIADPDEAAARDARMIADWAAGMKPPAPPRPGLGPGVHTGSAGGHLARQGHVRIHGGAPVMFDDAFGGPGALIARSASALADLPHRVQTALKDLGITLVALAGPETTGVTVFEDVDGIYASWLDELTADVVLVRPDFHVYGAGSSEEASDLATGFLSCLGGLKPVAVG
jgi:3-(3-hydroxy-phenyl)propionate hydroxylase